MSNTKQVIVMRTDLNMRKGKMAAQAAHASLSAFLTFRQASAIRGLIPIHLDEAAEDWFENSYTKICVGTDSLEELTRIYNEAKEAKLPCSFIVDNGTTEFHGEKTPTCVGIGPAYSEDIDKITGKLRLL